jgi:hypothetical protein
MRTFQTCITVITISSLASACSDGRPDPAQLASGQKVYAQHCAACHGAKLEGQPNWRARLPNGRMPAPPHDDGGHTWHHPEEVLFGITKYGLVPPYAPPGYGHVWYGAYAGRPMLTRLPLKDGAAIRVALPPLMDDAVAYIAQNPMRLRSRRAARRSDRAAG